MTIKLYIVSLFLLLGQLFAENTLSLEDNGDGTWNVIYSCEVEIAGFQFDIDAATIQSAAGGEAEAAGFMISASGNTVLGFSLTGSTIPSGDGVLVILVLDGTPEGLSGIIISDSDGQSIDFEYLFDCEELDDPDGVYAAFGITCDQIISFYGCNQTFANENICEVCSCSCDCMYGCTDDTACNYNEAATEEDNSCTYAEENYDCDGNCIVETDCLGICGGTSIDDDCGVCGGGNEDMDCEGTCFGDVEVDICGICGGDGTGCGTGCEEGVEVCLSVNGNNLDYNSILDIAGFQFGHDGCLTDPYAQGGDAAANGFMISGSASTVLAFSLTGAVIASGEGTLIELVGNPSEGCLSDFIFSDSAGDQLVVGFPVILISGCTDMDGCNYNPDANSNDGTCTYAQENYDCDGNCIVEVDCTGECGGEVEVDCAGECGGDAESDECGICEGTGIPDGDCD